MEYKLTAPCTAADLAPLRAGDTVLLSGVVYTARDQAHKRMMEALDAGEALPFPLEGSAIYYVGPTPERPGQVIGSAGPTTSGRMDSMSPRLLDLGNKIMIGKGKRDAAVKTAVRRNGAVYLAAPGRPGRGRGPDGQKRPQPGSDRLARPRVRGGPPAGSGGYAPDRHFGQRGRRPLRVRPGRVPGQPVTGAAGPVCSPKQSPPLALPAMM